MSTGFDRFIDRCLDRLYTRFGKRRWKWSEPQWEVKCSDEGFALHYRDRLKHARRWNEVVCVAAYIKHLWIGEELTLQFESRGQRVLEVGQDDIGWSDLLREADARFHFPREWDGAISLPGYDDPPLLLWKKDADLNVDPLG